jgi:competence protein ComEC
VLIARFFAHTGKWLTTLKTVSGVEGFLSQGTDRQVLWLPVAFGCGIALYFSLHQEPPFWMVPVLVLVLALVVLVAIVFNRFRPAGGAYRGLLLLFVLSAIAGFGTVQWRAHTLAAPVLLKKLPPTDLTGTLAKIDLRKNGLRLTLEDVSISGLEPAATPRIVRVTSRFDQPDLRPGDQVSVLAILLPPPEAALPGGFDFVRRAWFQQIGAVGYSIRKVIVTGRAEESDWRRAVADIRQQVTRRILKVFPDDPVTGHLAAALMTGHRGGVPEEIIQALRDAGLAHLLAISGLHIGLLAGLVFFVSRGLLALIEPVALRYPIKKFAAMLALAGAFIYLLMTGATIPTQRAFLMTGLVLVAVLLDRQAVSMALVAWAAGAVLLLSPESLTGPGFQMSFAAVVALIAVYERSRERLSRWRRGQGYGRRIIVYVVGVALTTVVASLATSPVAVAHFGRLAAWGLAANLIAVPVMALWIMPWALAAFVLMPFGLEQLALVPMGIGIDVVVDVARTVAAWPGAVQVLPAMPVLALGLLSLGALWICLNRPTKTLASGAPGGLLAGLILMACGFGLWFAATPPKVMIDGSGKLYGLVTADGNLRVNNRRDSFTLRAWLAGQGLEKADSLYFKYSTEAKSGSIASGLKCDSLGCLFQYEGQTIAIVKDLRALAEDCVGATAIVSPLPLRKNCLQPDIRIDRFDLWREGAHALWIDQSGRVTMKTVAGLRGQRLWSPNRQKPDRQKPDRPKSAKSANSGNKSPVFATILPAKSLNKP